MKEALIIFTKNPVHGKVKTRLAATVGNDRALEVYTALINHTHAITKYLNCDKIVFYADEIIENDAWKHGYAKHLQQGKDLGERMMNAFEYCFNQGYSKVEIIGTDCPELNEDTINSAFNKLNKYNVIIGAAADGGYYLLGMGKMHKKLFENIEWSTNKVFDKTIERCNQSDLTYFLLPLLHDVDEENDLPYMNYIL